ncbi:hypothetical protein [Streptomyces sp. NPDC046925]|uniref:hypothetical protein n=1 Tax=Streptomyces sp. NPDC046925 TaxID=3155375 RepID=UPI0033D3CE0C
MKDDDNAGAEEHDDENAEADGTSEAESGQEDPVGLATGKALRGAAARITSVNRALTPVSRQILLSEDTRRSIAHMTGAHAATVRAALDARRLVSTGYGRVFQDLFTDTYDWPRLLGAAVGRVSLPQSLLDQLGATAAMFLPANLRGLGPAELDTILELSAADGLSLGWAPRQEIVRTLVSLRTRDERSALLAERRADVLDDTETSLKIVEHPELVGMVAILNAAVRTARAGLDEGAQALAGNVLETAMKQHGNLWIRRSFPQVTYPKGNHHSTISSVLDDANDWGDLTLLQFKHFLVLAGMRNAFSFDDTQDTFNRHLGAHRASPDTYRPQFVLPAILLAHALLRALNQDLAHSGGAVADA